MTRRTRRVLLLAPIAALALAACSSGTSGSGNGNPNGNGFIAGDGSGGLLATRVAAPAISGPDIAGGPDISFRQFAGKVLVVNFYGSWCSPCRAETPLLVQASAANPQVQFLGVLMLDSKANGLSFRSTYGVTFPSIDDPDGTDLAKFRGVNPSAVPDTFVIDKSGKIAAKYVGGLKDEQGFQKVLTTLQSEAA